MSPTLGQRIISDDLGVPAEPQPLHLGIAPASSRDAARTNNALLHSRVGVRFPIQRLTIFAGFTVLLLLIRLRTRFVSKD